MGGLVAREYHRGVLTGTLEGWMRPAAGSRAATGEGP